MGTRSASPFPVRLQDHAAKADIASNERALSRHRKKLKGLTTFLSRSLS